MIVYNSTTSPILTPKDWIVAIAKVKNENIFYDIYSSNEKFGAQTIVSFVVTKLIVNNRLMPKVEYNDEIRYINPGDGVIEVDGKYVFMDFSDKLKVYSNINDADALMGFVIGMINKEISGADDFTTTIDEDIDDLRIYYIQQLFEQFGMASGQNAQGQGFQNIPDMHIGNDESTFKEQPFSNSEMSGDATSILRMEKNLAGMFFAGKLAVFCSSENEYVKLRKSLRSKGFICDAMLNEKGFDDVCKYVFYDKKRGCFTSSWRIDDKDIEGPYSVNIMPFLFETKTP